MIFFWYLNFSIIQNLLKTSNGIWNFFFFCFLCYFLFFGKFFKFVQINTNLYWSATFDHRAQLILHWSYISFLLIQKDWDSVLFIHPPNIIIQFLSIKILCINQLHLIVSILIITYSTLLKIQFWSKTKMLIEAYLSSWIKNLNVDFERNSFPSKFSFLDSISTGQMYFGSAREIHFAKVHEDLSFLSSKCIYIYTCRPLNGKRIGRKSTRRVCSII